MKRIIRFYAVLLFLAYTLASCGGGNNETKNEQKTDSSKIKNEQKVETPKPKEAVLKMYSKIDEDMGGSPCKSFILISIKNDSISGYQYRCAGGAVEIIHLFGKAINLDIKGISENAGGQQLPIIEYSKSEFSMKISSDSSKITFNKEEYKACKVNYSFTNKMLLTDISKDKTLFELPNLKSKSITTFNANKNKLKLLEIGKLEKIGKDYDIFYKVEVDGKIGWIYGGLNVYKM